MFAVSVSPLLRQIPAVVCVLLFLNACTTPMKEAEYDNPDADSLRKQLKEQHVPSEARRLFTAAFQQGWRDQPEAAFVPAQAEIYATGTAFHILAVLFDRDIGNRVDGFNQLTLQSGDVFEIFLQFDASNYYEFHITPENNHLFLSWTTGSVSAFRSGLMPLETFTLKDRSILESKTRIYDEGNYWTVYARIPFDKIGFEPRHGVEIRLAFARYDGFRDERPPVLSATPDFKVLDFHDLSAWHRIIF